MRQNNKKKKHYKGNLDKDFQKSLGKEGEGWLMGNFKKFKNGDIRKTKTLEIKYWDFDKKPFKHSSKKQKSATEYTFVLNGEIEGFVGDKKTTLKKGDFIIIKPKVVNNLVKKFSSRTKVLTIKTPSNPKDIIKINNRS